MQVLAVPQIIQYLTLVLDSDPVLVDVWIEGEVSSWSQHSSGHCYWTLRGGEAQLGAVCFRRDAARQSYLPRNGDLVLAHGRISLYNSRLQIVVDVIRPAGSGILQAQLEALKQRLEAEGLFERKRPLPSVPQRIGIVTSPTGAVIRDMLSVFQARWPLCEIVLSPSAVQGEDAPAQLVEALYALYEQPVDVIILARGGGAAEDLWAFNDEAVARAVFAAPVPIITGVGHETDTTLVDYVADLRAATPSVAAAAATPDIELLRENMVELRARLDDAATAVVEQRRFEVQEYLRRLERRSPYARLANDRQRVDQLVARLGRALLQELRGQKSALALAQARLHTLNPQATLERGYAIVRTAEGGVVTSSRALAPGTPLAIDLQDGTLHVATI